jgi:hypothetical protein
MSGRLVVGLLAARPMTNDTLQLVPQISVAIVASLLMDNITRNKTQAKQTKKFDPYLQYNRIHCHSTWLQLIQSTD